MTTPQSSAAPAVGVVNLANALTVLRLFLVPVFVVLLVSHGGHDTGWRVGAWAAFAVAAFTDRFDGQIARARGTITSFGKMADPIADKALTGAALCGLSSLGDLPWWVTIVIGVREIGITVLRFIVIRHGVIPASRGGKVKTFLQGVAIGLYVLPWSGWLGTTRFWILAVAVAVTLITGVDYIFRAIALRRAGNAARQEASA
ncbi:MAG TPA: CDP-alcohol phosphatidyltransferase family protein [Mycobacteriales bacterium]|nr:CDP-alcohol phosphatidyltransferase family protein [Mycobacteriales bacterium]